MRMLKVVLALAVALVGCTSGSGSSSSSSSSTSSSGGASSSGMTSSSSLARCPEDCGSLVTGAHHVSSWLCGSGSGLSACTPVCESSYDNCDQTVPDCEAALLTDSANCGLCGRNAGTASSDRCENGLLQCGTNAGTCTGTTPYCIPGAGGGGANVCFGCRDDGDCTTGGEVCCGGTCMAESAACGCAVVPGSMPATCDATAAGLLCIGVNGAVATGAEVHNAACGCGLANDLPVANGCPLNGNFQGLCAYVADDGGFPVTTDGGTGFVGECVPQNTPRRDGGVPAGNCGEVGVTCNPYLGGLTCGSDGGVGVCKCAGAADAVSCLTPMKDDAGVPHVVANTCSVTSCVCVGGSNTACDPTAANPDCCGGTGCVNHATDVTNCGACGTQCLGAAPECGAGALAAGQCGCSTDADAGIACPTNGGGGGRFCLVDQCVCAGADNVACPLGTTCSNSGSNGCCEWGVNVRPNSCLPPVGGVSCAADVAFPNRRVCFDGTSIEECCNNGCKPDGTCK